MQALCQFEVQGDAFDKELRSFLADDNLPANARDYAAEIISIARVNAETIDARIADVATNWPLKNMPLVDRNLLRAAVAEMTLLQAPAAVVINEAVEIAREYSTKDSPKFINAVLDQVRVVLEG
jgi:N utilization substance protein B